MVMRRQKPLLLANHPRPSFQKEGKAAGFPQCYGCAAAGASLPFVGVFPAFAAAYPAFGVSRFLGQKLSKGHLPQWGFRAVHT